MGGTFDVRIVYGNAISLNRSSFLKTFRINIIILISMLYVNDKWSGFLIILDELVVSLVLNRE